MLSKIPIHKPSAEAHILHHKIAFESIGRADFFFSEWNKVIDDSPLLPVPFENLLVKSF